MNYMILNMIGIAFFALFGLWAFQQGASARKRKSMTSNKSGCINNEKKQ